MYRAKRKALTSAEKMKLDDLLLIRFQQVQLPFLSTVLSFYPIDEHNEINTFLITDYLQFKNPHLHIAYPKTDTATHTMQAVICHEDMAFVKNKYNIPEPEICTPVEPAQLDAVLIPMLAFDERGYRVGFGKGYYDKFLHHCHPKCIKIGLNYFEAIDAIDDAHDFDVPLDLCITPQKVYVF